MPSGVYKRTNEYRAKLRAAKIGKRLSAKHRANISKSLKGNPKVIASAKLTRNGFQPIPLGQKHMTGMGYVEVKTSNGWEYEHRVIMGLKPGDQRVVHHIDGNQGNNNRENLQLFNSNTEHIRYHRTHSKD